MIGAVSRWFDRDCPHPSLPRTRGRVGWGTRPIVPPRRARGPAYRRAQISPRLEREAEAHAAQRAHGENSRRQAREGMELEIHSPADRRLFPGAFGGGVIGTDE